MAKFMGVHSGFTGIAERQFREAQDLDIEAAEGAHFERAWLDPDSGKVYSICRCHGSAEHKTRRWRRARWGRFPFARQMALTAGSVTPTLAPRVW